MYMKLYAEVMQSAASVEALVRGIWDLIGGGKLTRVADDGVRFVLCIDFCLIIDVLDSWCHKPFDSFPPQSG